MDGLTRFMQVSSFKRFDTHKHVLLICALHMCYLYVHYTKLLPSLVSNALNKDLFCYSFGKF